MRATSMLFLLCVLTAACDHSAPAPAVARPNPTPASAAPAKPPVKVPDFEFEPLRQQNVDLYLAVMREAAEKYKNLPPADKRVLADEKEHYTKMKSGWHPSPTEQESALYKRADELHHLDYEIAQQKGQKEMYSAIAETIEGMVGPHKCGDSDCGQGMPEDDPALRKKQIEDDAKRKPSSSRTWSYSSPTRKRSPHWPSRSASDDAEGAANPILAAPV